MKKVITIFVFCCMSITLQAQLSYPPTKIKEVTDTYFGVDYKDPYRWLEDLKDPAVETWFKQQAALTNSTMNTITGRDELIAEWKKLDKLQPAAYRPPLEENGRVFLQKRMPGEKVSKIYYRQGMQGKEVLLFDPLTFIPGKTLSVEQITPSYDGKKLIIAYSEQGAEISTIQVIDVDTKKFLPDVITGTAGAGGFTFDNNAFTYMWIKSADNRDPAGRLNPKMKLHRLGTDVKADIDFFSNERYPDLKIDARSYPFILVSKDEPNYVFAAEATVQNEMKMYYAPISQFNSGKIQWKKLVGIDDQVVRSFEVIDGKAYGITYKGAKNYKLVAVDLKNPDWNKAEIIGPEKKGFTLESFATCKDFILINYSDGINGHIYKYNKKDKTTTEVKLPFNGDVFIYCMNKKTNEYFIDIKSWNKPYTEFMYDAKKDAFSASSLNKPSVYPDEYKSLIVEEVEVKGHDGVMIPLTIIYKEGLKKDGSNVCFMDSYGAYGSSMTPRFSVRENSLAVKGVVVAIPHVRGGSEKGEEWYKAGYKTTKPNTWKDFISCGDYLVANGYTTPAKLGGTGTSAGGILISRAITERPDLFAAIICNVGCANTMRGEFSSNGPVNIPEFGTVKDETECKALYEMDGMHHVKEGVKYPAVMCVAGWNDSRVVAWQPGKFAAAMQNATSSGRPVLLKVNYDNGHFTEDKEVTFANFADQYAFVMWQCGQPDFKQKKN